MLPDFYINGGKGKKCSIDTGRVQAQLDVHLRCSRSSSEIKGVFQKTQKFELSSRLVSQFANH